MTDLEIAKNALDGHTIALCRNGELITDGKRGIAPMLGFISKGVDLRGFSAADLIVGKAAAMLFVKAGIKAVYAKTLSRGGKTVLDRYGVPVEYSGLTDKILNRSGTDVCPMEKAIADTDDIETAFSLLCAKASELGLTL